jgi:hypothetical protein
LVKKNNEREYVFSTWGFEPKAIENLLIERISKNTSLQSKVNNLNYETAHREIQKKKEKDE